ncbi:MAG: methyl-accepting chemotaxis protein, partial [Desulfobacterales bacterium]|nr:methyl-accepting chemotaxis protein [Desulfobacterales bacterium]
FKGEKKAQGFVEIPNTSWMLAVTVPVKEIAGQLKGFGQLAQTVIIICVLVLIISMYLIINKLIAQIRRIQGVVKRVEEGDLTQFVENKRLARCWEIMKCNEPDCPAYKSKNLRCWQIAGTHCYGEVQGEMAEKIQECEKCKTYQLSCGDEIGQISESLNNMVSTQREVIEMVHRSSDDVNSASNTLVSVIEEANAALEEISASTEELTATTQQIAIDLDGTTRQINDITEMSQENAKNAKDAEAKSVEIQDKAEAGGENALRTGEKMDTIVTQTKSMYTEMLNLKSATEQIQEIIDVINGIASQTNLLALNAQIEAARAGEHGRGFSVVANEINELASESTQATHQITEILNNIRIQVDNIGKMVNKEFADIEEGTNAVQTLKEQIIHISQAVDITGRAVKEIADFTVSQSDKAEDANEKISIIGDALVENIQTFEDINRSLAEQSAGFEEVGTLAEQLLEMCEGLRKRVAYFKTSYNE